MIISTQLLYKFPVYNDRSRSWFKMKERHWKFRSTKVNAGDFEHELIKSTTVNYGSENVKSMQIITAWQHISPAVNVKGFKKCCISSAVDGTEGDRLWNGI